MEYRSITGALKSIEDRTVVGIFSVFGNEDSYRDVIEKGAFKKTIKERPDKFRHLWQHDFWSPPVAKIDYVKEVGKSELPDHLQAIEEVTGGAEVSRTYLRTLRGDEILEGLQSGAINEMSFAFDIIKHEYKEVISEDGQLKYNRRHIKEVRLWETSDVLWGANPLTVGSKGLPFGVDLLLRDLDELLKLDIPEDQLVDIQEKIKMKLAQLAPVVKSNENSLTPLAQRVKTLELIVTQLEYGGIK